MSKIIKSKWLLPLFFIAIMSCLALTSCGDDNDEPDAGGNSIVGTWRCDNHYYGGADYYTFYRNGEYSWECPGSWHNPDSGSYSFNNGVLILVNKKGVSWVMTVQFLNKNNFILTDEDGYRYSYHKE